MFYMAMAADTTEEGRAALRAASHQYDFSVRPQVVRDRWDPFNHAVISSFSKKTGIFAILNTSFNLHGEPIVGGAKDALHTLQHSALRNLVLGDWLIRKVD
jgi:carbamoyltransferase